MTAKTKKLTKRQFFNLVNEEAAKLHRFQGKSLGYFQRPLPETYLVDRVGYLTSLYQQNFTAVEKDAKGDRHYVLFPEHPQKLEPAQRHIFEVWWLMAALLGIALARQAVMIHRVPHGPEPEHSDQKIVELVRQFLDQINPEIILQEER